MTPVERRNLDRVLAVVDSLKGTTKALETLHEKDASHAIAYFEKAPPLDDEDAERRLH
jgi:hypothetical protein